MRNYSAGINCTLFAPTKGSHFQALHPLSFLFLCTLHWCKHCTVLEIAANVRKFAITALCGITAQGFSGPSSSVRFLHRSRVHISGSPSFSFLFICILHWCKHCTVLEVTTNVRKCPMTALCGNTAQKQICRPVPPVRFLHRPRVHIFSHSIPLASFSYAPCIGAYIIPCKK